MLTAASKHKDIPLSNVSIVDLTTKLPGPYATYKLSELGAKIIRFEDIHYRDPFIQGELANKEENFIEWYRNFNSDKETISVDFDNPKDVEMIQHTIANSAGAIIGLPKKILSKIQLTKNDIQKNFLDKPIAIIKIKATASDEIPLHDLNALADSGILQLYVQDFKENIISPPFLPVAGLTFGQDLATNFLAGFHYANQHQTLWLKDYLLSEATNEIMEILWPSTMRATGQKRFLHNGRFPCYAIYRTSNNGFVSLATIEKKFWRKFCELFELNFTDEQRFDS